MLVYILYFSIPSRMVFLFLFIILLSLKFSSPKLNLVLLLCLIIGVIISLSLSSLQKGITTQQIPSFNLIIESTAATEAIKVAGIDSQINIEANESVKTAEDHTSNYLDENNRIIQVEENLPAPNNSVSLKIIGIQGKNFLYELEEHLRSSCSKKGQYIVEFIYDGISYSRNNQDLGKVEYNYQEGSLIINIAGKPCIKKGEYRISATDYRGLSKKELEGKLEEKKMTILLQELSPIAKKLWDCIP